MTKKEFGELLLQAIDEALTVLGESAKHAIYFHLQYKFEIAREDIPDHLESFEKGLEKIFGLGAQYIEILIMKKLYEKSGKSVEWKDSEKLIFVEYVAAVKKGLQKRKDVETLAA